MQKFAGKERGREETNSTGRKDEDKALCIPFNSFQCFLCVFAVAPREGSVD